MNIIPTEPELENLLRTGQLPVAAIFYDLPAGYELIRARYHNSDFRPSRVAEIYYPPDPEKIHIGRANDWNQQVFYGMLPTGGRGPRLAAYQEIADDVNPIPTFTVSRWRLKKPLTGVLSLIMHEAQAGGNDFAQLTYQRNMAYIEDLPFLYRGQVKRTLDQIGQMFAKKVTDCDYRRTVEFANYYFNEGFNAIIYPSVSYDYKAVCIAMPKHVADEYLQAVRGGLIQIHLMDGGQDECCYQTFTVEGGTLKWTDYDDGQKRPPFTSSFIPQRDNPCRDLRDRLRGR